MRTPYSDYLEILNWDRALDMCFWYAETIIDHQIELIFEKHTRNL